MEIAGDLLRQMVVLFIMMGLGFLLVKTRMLKSSDSKSLSVVAVMLINPAAVLQAFQIEFTDWCATASCSPSARRC